MWSRGIFEQSTPLDQERQVVVGHTTTQVLMGDDSDGIWESPVLLPDGRPSAIGIDTGIYLPPGKNPRLTAVNLADGTLIAQQRIEDSYIEITP
jgi:hypothetical protein